MSPVFIVITTAARLTDVPPIISVTAYALFKGLAWTSKSVCLLVLPIAQFRFFWYMKNIGQSWSSSIF